jgi:hypothetical protein
MVRRRACQHPDCSKGATGGGTPHCVAHGGGRRCKHAGCTKAVAKGIGSVFCTPCESRWGPGPLPPVHTRSHRSRFAAGGTSDEEEEEEKEHDDECTLCGDRGGFLISCSFCARSFHFDCLDQETLLSLTAEPSGDASWACPRKACKVPSLLTISVRLGVRVSFSSLRCELWGSDRRLWANSEW